MKKRKKRKIREKIGKRRIGELEEGKRVRERSRREGPGEREEGP